MASKKKAPPVNRRADQFYDYLIAHKPQVLRYITAALVTGIFQFLLQYFLQLDSLSAFLLRFLVFLPWLKLGVYRQKLEVFETLKQLMIAIMLVVLSQVGINYLILFFSSLWGHGKVVYYICTAILEILYFLIFQFVVFKEKKD